MRAFYILLIINVLTIGFLFAQTSQIKEKSMITNKSMTINIKGDYREAKRTPLRPKYVAIYRRNTEKLLLGNNCAEIVMQDYGMRYVVVPSNFKMSGTKYFFNNFFGGVKLFFQNGPFWRAKMHKKIEKCRKKTGDYVF